MIYENYKGDKMNPIRTCMGCNKKENKDDFIRIVKYNNKIFIDSSLKHEGRGAYLCKDLKCLKKIKKNKRLNNSFKMNISNEIYENLRRVIVNGKN